MAFALKCKVCFCVLRAPPISPLTLITQAVGSNDSNRVSPPHLTFCYLAVRNLLFRVSVVRVQADPPNGAPPLFIYPQLLVYHIGSYRPYLQVVCSADSVRLDHAMVTAPQLDGRDKLWWFCFGEAAGAGRATIIALLHRVCWYMLIQHLAISHHYIIDFVVK